MANWPLESGLGKLFDVAAAAVQDAGNIGHDSGTVRGRTPKSKSTPSNTSLENRWRGGKNRRAHRAWCIA